MMMLVMEIKMTMMMMMLTMMTTKPIKSSFTGSFEASTSLISVASASPGDDDHDKLVDDDKYTLCLCVLCFVCECVSVWECVCVSVKASFHFKLLCLILR